MAVDILVLELERNSTSNWRGMIKSIKQVDKIVACIRQQYILANSLLCFSHRSVQVGEPGFSPGNTCTCMVPQKWHEPMYRIRMG